MCMMNLLSKLLKEDPYFLITLSQDPTTILYKYDYQFRLCPVQGTVVLQCASSAGIQTFVQDANGNLKLPGDGKGVCKSLSMALYPLTFLHKQLKIPIDRMLPAPLYAFLRP